MFDSATNNLVATVTVTGTGALAVNTTTNKVYVLSFRFAAERTVARDLLETPGGKDVELRRIN